MLADRIRNGVSIGLIGAAATAGGLVGLGLRHGGATRPFEMGGRALLGAWRLATPVEGVAISVGVVAHLLWMTLWGVCFSVVAT
ncbi:MAG: hypothetical protein HY766_15585, partial [candidate division NC10 bacterium]|nr:hypothetical protein [candidate division NC10 bacterium]